jgi:hypothetical protein
METTCRYRRLSPRLSQLSRPTHCDVWLAPLATRHWAANIGMTLEGGVVAELRFACIRTSTCRCLSFGRHAGLQHVLPQPGNPGQGHDDGRPPLQWPGGAPKRSCSGTGRGPGTRGQARKTSCSSTSCPMSRQASRQVPVERAAGPRRAAVLLAQDSQNLSAGRCNSLSRT